MSAARHAPDVDALVERALHHADAVAEERATAERRRRIDRDDGDAIARVAVRAGQPVHERALATARRTGDADDARRAGLRVQVAQDVGRTRLVVLDDGEEPRDATFVAPAGARDEVGGNHAMAFCTRSRAMMMRCTSLVPSPISMSRASRRWRSTG